jgi:PKD repeat protein
LEGTRITESDWVSAIQCTDEPSPNLAGSAEAFVVTGLSPDTTYYFALKTADEVPNWSPISNSPSGKTEPGEVSIISIDPSSSKISAGSTAKINLTLDKAPNGLSGYNLTVSLSDVTVAELVSVSYPSWATLHDNSTLPADSIWMKATDLSDQVKSGAIEVNLGTLTLRGDNQGTSDIVITVTKMDDDNGYPINPNTISGQIEVTSVIPIPGHTNPPSDPDSDGLYEDLNGNGMKDFDDVVQFFKYLEWIEDNEPIACFDFNGNGLIDFADIVTLFKEV